MIQPKFESRTNPRLGRFSRKWIGRLLVIGLASIALVACSSNSNATAPRSSGATSQEVSVSGDIPDSQVFVPYQSPDGYTIDVPQGWARSNSASSVTFADKFNSVSVQVSQSASPPTLDEVKSTVVPALATLRMNFQKIEAKTVSVGSAQVIRVRYRSDSAPDSVTGKSVQLETDLYLFYKNGQQASLSLSAPVGADNVDAWNQVAASFKWG